MRILILGAGALGGYFGGRLLEGGASPVFLVRPRRREQLARDGLVIESPFGALRRPVETVTAETVGPGWDVVLLSCKAYDLEDSIAAIRPAVDGRTAILPVLNGLTHIQALEAAFGQGRVLGGLARINATLTPDGTIRHFDQFRAITFGELDGTMSPRVEALQAAFRAAPNDSVQARAVPDIRAQMWDKLVFLGTLAAASVLMRATLGEIVRGGGTALLQRMLEGSATAAEAAGYPLKPAALDSYRKMFADPGSGANASMLRDLEAGGRIEVDHVVGTLLEAVRAAGVDPTLHEAAYVHGKSYEQRRAAGRLPR
ncbi:ketopantoate reductase family protein [Roseomonas sp. NAR14]|uniref:2-dehydropantoate 2-reductase n=1 Tax=Roseomonas acroporae TaxID=2937791 RepID=A0A9X1YAJ0_9PROT|nr:ketopantoate reductase family protein [Roseomonas acroporae]MCK8785390.1 ketopantoate reductase family protein [Roseomonas acroporae]